MQADSRKRDKDCLLLLPDRSRQFARNSVEPARAVSIRNTPRPMADTTGSRIPESGKAATAGDAEATGDECHRDTEPEGRAAVPN